MTARLTKLNPPKGDDFPAIDGLYGLKPQSWVNCTCGGRTVTSSFLTKQPPTGSTVHTGFTQEVSVCAGSCAGLGTPQLSQGGQNVTSKVAMEKHLERERTKISLAEFYAATPEPSPKAKKPNEAVPTEHLRQSEPMEAFVEETQEDLTSEDNDDRSTKPTGAITQPSISTGDRTVPQTAKPSTDFQDPPVLEDLEVHPEDVSMSVDEGISSGTAHLFVKGPILMDNMANSKRRLPVHCLKAVLLTSAGCQGVSRPMVPVPPSKRPSTSSDTQSVASVASLWSSRELPSSKSVTSSKTQIPSTRRPSFLRNVASSTSPQGQDAASHRVEIKRSHAGFSEKQTSHTKRDPVERKPYLRSHPFQPASVQQRKGGEGMWSRHRDNQDVSFPAGGLPLSKVTGLTRYPMEGSGSSQSSEGMSPNPLVSDVMGPSWEQPVFSSGTAWRAKSRAKDPILSGSKTDPKPPQQGKRGEVGPS
ncbi:hypothetical protein Bbelb_444820 [Branchiostoma belcheri]|nr:hypothetical protein Bbelb_444820 [Branchiostoma belcheri]